MDVVGRGVVEHRTVLQVLQDPDSEAASELVVPAAAVAVAVAVAVVPIQRQL